MDLSLIHPRAPNLFPPPRLPVFSATCQVEPSASSRPRLALVGDSFLCGKETVHPVGPLFEHVATVPGEGVCAALRKLSDLSAGSVDGILLVLFGNDLCSRKSANTEEWWAENEIMYRLMIQDFRLIRFLPLVVSVSPP